MEWLQMLDVVVRGLVTLIPALVVWVIWADSPLILGATIAFRLEESTNMGRLTRSVISLILLATTLVAGSWLMMFYTNTVMLRFSLLNLRAFDSIAFWYWIIMEAGIWLVCSLMHWLDPQFA